MKKRLEHLKIKTKALGLSLEISRPGDGYSRYTFYSRSREERLFTAVGIKEAFVWIGGFSYGKHRN